MAIINTFPKCLDSPYLIEDKDASARVGALMSTAADRLEAAANINYNIHNPTINENQRTSFGFSTVNFAVDWRF